MYKIIRSNLYSKYRCDLNFRKTIYPPDAHDGPFVRLAWYYGLDPSDADAVVLRLLQDPRFKRKRKPRKRGRPLFWDQPTHLSLLQDVGALVEQYNISDKEACIRLAKGSGKWAAPDHSTPKQWARTLQSRLPEAKKIERKLKESGGRSEN